MVVCSNAAKGPGGSLERHTTVSARNEIHRLPWFEVLPFALMLGIALKQRTSLLPYFALIHIVSHAMAAMTLFGVLDG